MAMNHKATPEQWASVKQAYEPIEMRPGVFLGTKDTTIAACLLELRARVEALEAISKPTPNSFQIGRSLVNRVALAISGIEYGLERDEEAVNWEPEARAAIRKVAEWLREQDPEPGPVGKWLGQISTPCGVMADMIEQEADR